MDTSAVTNTDLNTINGKLLDDESKNEPDSVDKETINCGVGPCRCCNKIRTCYRNPDKKCEIDGCNRSAYGRCGDGEIRNGCCFSK